MKICVKISLLLLFIVLSQNSIAASSSTSTFIVPKTFKFSKNINYGLTYSPDVSYLQNILNLNPVTEVATGTDAGSDKNLTNYFGLKTKTALQKFQDLYINEINNEQALLYPNKATSTYVKLNSNTLDIYTRNFLNKLILILNINKENVTAEDISSDILNATNAKNTQEVKRFDLAEEQKRSTDISPEGIDKNIFMNTPEGQLVKLIGGYSLVDKIYNYTPGGMINSKISGSGQSGSGSSGLGGAGVLAGGAVAAGGLLGGGASAATASVLQPFGGVSTMMVTCTCSANLLLYVTDPRGMVLPLIYQPGVTVLYKMYQPRSGVNMLGKYIAGGSCRIYVGSGCVSGGTPVGTMTQLGTSVSLGK